MSTSSSRSVMLLLMLPMVLAAFMASLIALWSLQTLKEENQERYLLEEKDLSLLSEAAYLGNRLASTHQLAASALDQAANGTLDEAGLYRLHSQIVDSLAELDQRTRALSDALHAEVIGLDNARIMIEDFEGYRSFMLMATDIAAIDPTTAKNHIHKAQEYFIDLEKQRQTINGLLAEHAREHSEDGHKAFHRAFIQVLGISIAGLMAVILLSLLAGKRLSRHLVAIIEALQLLSRHSGLPPDLPNIKVMASNTRGQFQTMASAVLAFRKAIKERHEAQEEIEHHHDNLEALVRERTAELEASQKNLMLAKEEAEQANRPKAYSLPI